MKLVLNTLFLSVYFVLFEADLEHKSVQVLAKREMGREDFLKLLKDTSYTLLDIE